MIREREEIPVINKLLQKGFVFLDGAFGTMLQSAGLKLGERPESLSLTQPELIKSIHKAYIEAGSDIIYANTFGANSHKFQDTDLDTTEVVTASVKLAKEAAQGTSTLVALDIGSVGELLEPLGALSFDEAYDIFKEVIVAGEAAGVDLVVFETISDLYELKAGVLAAKENSKLPIFVTMTFEENRRTFTGTTIEAMAVVMEGLGVDALGINCSLGPVEILPIATELSKYTSLPIIVKPNAGLPNPVDSSYDLSPEDFATQMAEYEKIGVSIVGGCCGTTPAHIKAMIDMLKDKTPTKVEKERVSKICSPSKVVAITEVRSIGERINPTGKKRFKEALAENDMGYIATQAIEQAEAGADILDVNVGAPGIEEASMMINTVKAIQSVVDLPLQIDSSEAKAIETGLRYYNGKAIVNSVNGEDEVLDRILPLVKKYGAAVVGLAMDGEGIPTTSAKRIEIAEKILQKALSYGIPREDIYIDCLALTVSAQQNQARETLDAIRYVRHTLGLHCVLGVSNISFGLPNRELITRTFLIQAMECGLDLPIINPNHKSIMEAISAYKVLSGSDVDSMDYIANYTGVETKVETKTSTMDVEYAIIKGLTEDCGRITKELLKTNTELEIINNLLIPALDKVGEKYEKGEIFLPQLIASANASCSAFEVIKTSIINSGGDSVSKGKIILATVKGDIHDIGKNIVKVILENYGYTVIDLGRDVPINLVVETAIKEQVKLIGLSALMTTTLKSMEETITALRQSGHSCKVVVGGAVLTPEYAEKIGADYYAVDAKKTVDIAKELLG